MGGAAISIETVVLTCGIIVGVESGLVFIKFQRSVGLPCIVPMIFTFKNELNFTESEIKFIF